MGQENMWQAQILYSHILVYEKNIWSNMVYTRVYCILRSYHFSYMGTVSWCFRILWYLSNAYYTILPGLKWKQHSIHQVSEILSSELDILVYTSIYTVTQFASGICRSWIFVVYTWNMTSGTLRYFDIIDFDDTRRMIIVNCFDIIVYHMQYHMYDIIDIVKAMIS